MALKGNKNSSTVSMFRSTSRITTPSFISVENGKTYFTPALTSRSQTIGDYIYSASATTFVGVKDSTIYYAAKSREVAYDIPAGTYSPSVFESLVSKFVSQNSRRKIRDYNFSIIVNNKNVFTPYEDVYIGYYTQTGGSGLYGTFRYIQFSPSTALLGDSRRDLEIQDINFRGLYVVYSDGLFNGYNNYPIRITSGIKFV